MGLIPAGALERLEAAQREVEQRPGDASAWIALSQARQTLVDEPEMLAAARRAVELAPQSVDALRQLATSLWSTGPGLVEATPLFEKLYALDPNDLTVAHYMYNIAVLRGDFRRGIEFSEQADRIHPHSPFTSARIARMYRMLGEEASAVELFNRAAAYCEDDQHPFPSGPYANLMPLYAALAGDAARSEALSLQLCQKDGVGLADMSHPRYPADCLQALEKMRAMVAGRDMLVFGNGPSLAEIVSRRSEVASLDFASATMSSFQIAQETILGPIGKKVDLACMTHPTMISTQAAATTEWFLQAPNFMLMVPLWARELAEVTKAPEFMLEEAGRMIWFDCVTEHMPSPKEPLHVPALNTLLCALCVALHAKPRQIFLFGFDGKIKGDDSQQAGTLYFQEHDPSYHTIQRARPEIRDYTRTSLLWDSMLFNEIAPIALRHTALLFNLPAPSIYNVCHDSAIEVFPRISFDRFLEIAKG